MTSQNKIWNKLSARGFLARKASNKAKDADLEECLIVCEYLSKRQLDGIVKARRRYIDAYSEAAESELMERTMLGKKRKII